VINCHFLKLEEINFGENIYDGADHQGCVREGGRCSVAKFRVAGAAVLHTNVVVQI